MAYNPEGYYPDGYQPDGYTPSVAASPSLSVVLAGLVATATITSGDEATNYLIYKSTTDLEWKDGGSRLGSGNIVVSGLIANTQYVFQCYSEENGNRSVPSLPVVLVTEATATENDFDGQLYEDADLFLAAFGILTTFRPKSGGSRQVLAIIDYDQVGILPATDSTTTYHRVTVKNSATDGYSTAEVDTGGDTVDVPIRHGGTPETRRIIGIDYQDNGMVFYQVA